jgi:hypothetical protein
MTSWCRSLVDHFVALRKDFIGEPTLGLDGASEHPYRVEVHMRARVVLY